MTTGGFCLVLCAALAACRTDGESAVVGPPRDGGFGEVPTRTVVTEFPDVAFPADTPTLLGGGTSGGNKDAGSDRGAPDPNRPPDAAPVDLATGPCSVVQQDCGARRGCYPTASGGGACAPAGDLTQFAPCGAHEQCAPGLLCVQDYTTGSLCQPACETGNNDTCLAGEICRRYEGALGVCSP